MKSVDKQSQRRDQEDKNEFCDSAHFFSVYFIRYVEGFTAGGFERRLYVFPDAVAEVGAIVGETQDRASQETAAAAR